MLLSFCDSRIACRARMCQLSFRLCAVGSHCAVSCAAASPGRGSCHIRVSGALSQAADVVTHRGKPLNSTGCTQAESSKSRMHSIVYEPYDAANTVSDSESKTQGR